MLKKIKTALKEVVLKSEKENPDIGIYYYKKRPNFGDILNVSILRRFGVRSHFEDYPTTELIAIGSILDLFIQDGGWPQHFNDRMLKEGDREKTVTVWGSGLMYRYDNNHPPVRPLNILALRGELTRQKMSMFTGETVSCTLADPGLLAPYLVPNQKKKWDVAIIPHMNDMQDETFLKMKEYYGSALIIDVREKPEKVLQQIAESRSVLSTGLHGLIVADAYNVPNCWCEISDKVEGDGYKFHDYFSSFGTDRERFDLRKGSFPDLDKDCKSSFVRYRDVKTKQKELIDSFPYPIPFYRKNMLLSNLYKRMK